jgi:hypothetical protein
MTPKAIVETALSRGLSMIAVCDHNSARNTAATRRAATGTGLVVLPGVEVTTVEEVHLVGLFPGDVEASAMQDEIYSRLPGENDEDVFGVQAVVNEYDEVEDLDNRLLIGATTMPCERVVEIIHSLGGLAVAAHVDREGYGIFSKLGFIPDGVALDALEISRRTDFDRARARFRQCRQFTLITSSDAHAPEDIGAAFTLAMMSEPSFGELRMALRGEDGRRILERAPDAALQ